jgi:hypothetical protein
MIQPKLGVNGHCIVGYKADFSYVTEIPTLLNIIEGPQTYHCL